MDDAGEKISMQMSVPQARTILGALDEMEFESPIFYSNIEWLHAPHQILMGDRTQVISEFCFSVLGQLWRETRTGHSMGTAADRNGFSEESWNG